MKSYRKWRNRRSENGGSNRNDEEICQYRRNEKNGKRKRRHRKRRRAAQRKAAENIENRKSSNVTRCYMKCGRNISSEKSWHDNEENRNETQYREIAQNRSLCRERNSREANIATVKQKREQKQARTSKWHLILWAAKIYEQSRRPGSLRNEIYHMKPHRAQSISESKITLSINAEKNHWQRNISPAALWRKRSIARQRRQEKRQPAYKQASAASYARLAAPKQLSPHKYERVCCYDSWNMKLSMTVHGWKRAWNERAWSDLICLTQVKSRNN